MLQRWHPVAELCPCSLFTDQQTGRLETKQSPVVDTERGFSAGFERMGFAAVAGGVCEYADCAQQWLEHVDVYSRVHKHGGEII